MRRRKLQSKTGTLFDAAVAGAFDLMVSNPLMASIGGGGFATVKVPGKDPVVFDFFDVMPGMGLDKSEFGKNILASECALRDWNRRYHRVFLNRSSGNGKGA